MVKDQPPAWAMAVPNRPGNTAREPDRLRAKVEGKIAVAAIAVTVIAVIDCWPMALNRQSLRPAA
jgi:hypothetical protein